MRWVAGVCFSSICAGSCGSLIAPLVLLGPPYNHSSLLVPEALVSGVSGVGSSRADGSASDRDLLYQPHVHRQQLVLLMLALHAW